MEERWQDTLGVSVSDEQGIWGQQIGQVVSEAALEGGGCDLQSLSSGTPVPVFVSSKSKQVILPTVPKV